MFARLLMLCANDIVSASLTLTIEALARLLMLCAKDIVIACLTLIPEAIFYLVLPQRILLRPLNPHPLRLGAGQPGMSGFLAGIGGRFCPASPSRVRGFLLRMNQHELPLRLANLHTAEK